MKTIVFNRESHSQTKISKLLLVSAISFFLVNPYKSEAQIPTYQTTFYVNNNAGVAANFSSLQAALDSVPAGSTIMLAPSKISYPPAIVRKKVNIIGNGYFLSGNNTPLSAKQTDTLYSQIQSIHFEKGADGCQISGLYFPQSNYDTTQSNIFFDSVSNIIIQNCYLEPVKPITSLFTQTYHFSFTASNNLIIRQCYINHTDNLTAGCWLMNAYGTNDTTKNSNSNIYFQNNIIVGKAEILPNSGSYPTFYFDHNTIITTGVTFNFGGILFTNNIFFKLPASTADTTIHTSLVAADSMSYSNISNFVFLPNSSKNKITAFNYPTDSLFINQSPISSYTGIDNYYQLKSAANIAKGYASDTTDCGAFGGHRPYILSGIPPVPNIYNFTRSFIRDPFLVLNIIIQAHGNNGILGDTSLKLIQGEYFYDKDPGVGICNQFNDFLSGPKSDVKINDTIAFDTTKFTRLYIRFKDQNGFWSLMKDTLIINPSYNPNQPTIDSFKVNSFDTSKRVNVIISATAHSSITNDTVKIVRVEYFYDWNDPGLGKGIALPFTIGKSINLSDTILIPDNSKDSIQLNFRAIDNKGNASLISSKHISLCKLYPKTIANFGYIINGNLISLIDSSKNNPQHALRWYYNTTHFIDTIQNPARYLPFGFDTLILYTGTGCRMDSMIKIVDLFAVEGVYPKTVQAGGNIHIQVNGSGFDNTTTLTIIDSSGNQYQPTSYDYGNQNLSIGGTFDFHPIQINNIQLWDVRITNNNININKIDTILRRSIIVIPKPVDSTQLTPYISVVFNTPQNVLANTWTEGAITVTNLGNVISKLTEVNIFIDNRMQDVQLVNPNFFYPPNQFSDSIQSILLMMPECSGNNPYIVDSLNLPASSINGDFRHYSLLVSAINPGQSIVIKVKFLTPVSYRGKLNFFAFARIRMVGSYFTDVLNVVSFVVGTVVGVIGVVASSPVVVTAAAITGVVIAGTVILAQAVDNYNTGQPFYCNQWANITGLALNVSGFGVTKLLGPIAQEAKIFGQALATGSQKVLNYTVGALTNAGSIYLGQHDNGGGAIKSIEDIAATTVSSASTSRSIGSGSYDPNEIIGPSGIDTSDIISNKFIDNKTSMNYKIEFENDTSATRAAQRIVIIDTLNPSKFDLSSFQLQGFTIGDSTYTISNFLTQYNTTVNLVPTQGVLVRFNAKLDTLTGILSTNFTALDPNTMNTVSDTSLLGFLPPDLDSHSGKGSVSYIINQNRKLVNLDTISNKANIYFDNNAPMTTSPWKNTIDINPPTGKATNFHYLSDTSFVLYMSNVDKESGAGSNNIYCAINNGSFNFIGKSNTDSIIFRGQKDSVYHFYSTPNDNVGNFTNKQAASEVTVPLFNTTPLTGVSQVCINNKIKLSTTTLNGKWISSNTTIATVDTIGNVTGANAGNCLISYKVTMMGVTDSVSKNITVIAIPSKPTIQRDVNNNLVSSATAGNQWFNGTSSISAAINQTYRPVTEGSYSVQVTQNGCISPISDPYYYLVTAINNVNGNGSINVYPNPVSNILIIEYKLTNLNAVTAELFDINGKKLLQKSILSGTGIDLSRYASGSYTLKLTDNISHKLIYSCNIIKSK